MSKILVVCQYYYPEPVRITDICEELVKRENEVTVITDIPNYPMGDIYEGYSLKEKRDEVINGVKVHRCLTIPRKKNAIMRLLNYHSFSFFSKLYVGRIKEEYDVVLINQLSPVMMANAGIKYAKKHNKKLVMYCLDIWPESLCAGGIKKNSLIYKIYFIISKKIYRKMDKILVTSKSFIPYISENFDIDKSKFEYLPQYAESIFMPEECRKTPDENIDLVFAGNVGKAQSIDTILEAAKILKDRKNLYWHIVGDGQELQNAKDKARREDLDHVIFYGRRPLEDMPKYYKMADAMLVTLCGDSLISQTIPGKVQTYMAAGKPIIGSANGETKEVIEEANCGFCGSADNAQELANAVVNFIDSNNKEDIGNNSYDYYQKHFEKNNYINELIKHLN